MPTTSPLSPFQIKIALLGTVSSGKTTLLNALLGGKYGDVSMNEERRTTKAVHYFRVASTQTDENEKAISMANNGAPLTKDTVLEQTVSENDDASVVSEKWSDVKVQEDLVEMRQDTQIVLIDTPGLDDKSSAPDDKYKDYIHDKWNTFDCVILVLDGGGVVNLNEAAQLELLNLVKQNLVTKKNIPVIVLFNKMDDPNHPGFSCSVQTAEKVVQSVLLAEQQTNNSNNNNSSNDSNETTTARTMTTFLPFSSLQAFVHRFVPHLKTIKEFQQFYENDPWMPKIAREQIGCRRFRKLSKQEQMQETYDALTADTENCQQALMECHFTPLLQVLQQYVGGQKTQTALLEKQLEMALQTLLQTLLSADDDDDDNDDDSNNNNNNNNNGADKDKDKDKDKAKAKDSSTATGSSNNPQTPPGDSNKHINGKKNLLATRIAWIYQTFRGLDSLQPKVPFSAMPPAPLRATFWKAYTMAEECALEEFHTHGPAGNVAALARPVQELTCYAKVCRDHGWNEDAGAAVVTKIEGYLRRVLALVIERANKLLECWEVFDEYEDAPTWNSLSPLDWTNMLGALLRVENSNSHCWAAFRQEKNKLDGLYKRAVTTWAEKIAFNDCPFCCLPLTTPQNQNNADLCRPCQKVFCREIPQACIMRRRRYMIVKGACLDPECNWFYHKKPDLEALSQKPPRWDADGNYVCRPALPEEGRHIINVFVPDSVADPRHLGHCLHLFSEFLQELEGANDSP